MTSKIIDQNDLQTVRNLMLTTGLSTYELAWKSLELWHFMAAKVISPHKQPLQRPSESASMGFDSLEREKPSKFRENNDLDLEREGKIVKIPWK